MGMPVVTVVSGGLPVVDVTATTGRGTPVSEAINLRGTAVTKVASGGGIPVVFDTGGGAPTTPLDGLSPTAAWSLSRKLLSAFAGTRFTTATGVNSLNDQSGNSRHLIQGTTTLQPLSSTAGPNSRACADFDGVDDVLVALSAALSNHISAASGYMIASVLIDTFPTNAAISYNNSAILLDTGKNAGMTVRSGNIFYAYNWDGNEDKAQGTVNAATTYVVEWRHEGGNLYQRVNGGNETSVASGNSVNLTSPLTMGMSGTFDGKIFEAATFSTVPSQLQRDALAADFKAWIG